MGGGERGGDYSPLGRGGEMAGGVFAALPSHVFQAPRE